MLKERVLSAAVMVPVVLGACYLGGLPFAALVTLVALVAGYEFLTLMRQAGFKPYTGVGLALIVLLMLDAWHPAWALWRPALVALIAAPMVWSILRREMDGFLTGWAMSSDWECSFKRITEVGNVVFLELEERSKIGDFKSVVNSMSVYEFDAGGKIHHIDVYLQMELPDPDMLKSYEGVL